MVNPLLPFSLDKVTVTRRGRTILGPTSLRLEAPGLTAVMGPNGSGKTTFLRAIHGVERLSTGRVLWPVPEQEARDRQAYVFQRPIMMRRTVIENLCYPLQLSGVGRNAARARAVPWLERIGLADLAQTQATRLSGGEQQKLALARALMTQPAILFLDEPCANLDGRATREIEAILQDTKAQGTHVILATHDLGQARRLATDVVFLLGGHLHEYGASDALFETPETPELRAFLKGDIVE